MATTISFSSPMLQRCPHPELYFVHGDVILEAPITKNLATPMTPSHSLLFRVHKFLLGHHSPMFRDMFSIPTPAHGDETHDGCSVVRLTHDDADDLAMLLNMLYNPVSHIPCKRFDPSAPIVLAGVIRLSTKYQIDSLRERLIQHVVADWPTTLEQYDRYEGEMKELRAARAAERKAQGIQVRNPPFTETPPHADRFPEPAAALAFAREFDCPQILPAVFYRLAITDAADDWEHPREYQQKAGARWPLVTSADFHRLLHGRERLLQYVDSLCVPDDLTVCDESVDGKLDCLEAALCIIRTQWTPSWRDGRKYNHQGFRALTI